MNRTFTIQRRVQFAETDLAGVLHFANYLRIMEETEHAFWRELGMSVVADGGGRHISWPRVQVHCEYHAPARFEDELDLDLQLVHLGGRSLKFEITFRRGAERLAVGRFTTVCCELHAGGFHVIDIPEDVRSKLQNYLVSTDGG